MLGCGVITWGLQKDKVLKAIYQNSLGGLLAGGQFSDIMFLHKNEKKRFKVTHHFRLS